MKDWIGQKRTDWGTAKGAATTEISAPLLVRGRWSRMRDYPDLEGICRTELMYSILNSGLS
jgi:hypothetical protein